jgi:hypothetical protein
MQLLNAIAACCILVGVLNLAGFLGSQMGAGHATGGSLIFGGGLLAYGVMLSGVANVGIKLNRIEQRLRERADDAFNRP